MPCTLWKEGREDNYTRLLKQRLALVVDARKPPTVLKKLLKILVSKEML